MRLPAHLIMYGFNANYKIQNMHGDLGINPGEPREGFVYDIGDQGPSSTNNEGGQLGDDEILSINEDYVDLVDDMDQMMKDVEANNEDEYTDLEYAKFKDLVRDSNK